MFDRVSGLPAHPLIVHGAVVFVPLLALGAILYAVAPLLRGHLRWPVGLLGIVAPLSIIAAKLSGEDFKANKNVQSPQMQALISVHEGYGNKAMWSTIALGVVVVIFVFLIRPRVSAAASGDAAVATRPVALQIAFAVVAVVLAVIVAYYVYKVGDSGAHMAWSGY